MPRYTPATIEPKWQRYWEEHKTFKTPAMPPEGEHGEKRYVLDMFPYPSGSGLHVGHPEGYTATDIVCRFARMNGKCVLHPMGFDAFGLPAEEHAIKTNTPPRINTEQNIATFRRQLKMLGFSYDWDRELATTDVEYFRWPSSSAAGQSVSCRFRPRSSRKVKLASASIRTSIVWPINPTRWSTGVLSWVRCWRMKRSLMARASAAGTR
jgi:hypothetical protein